MQIQHTVASKAEFDPAASDRKFCLAVSDYVTAVLIPQAMQEAARKAPGIRFELVRLDENIEQKFPVPMLGNRYMLRTEERGTPRNQLWLLQKAGILTPRTFKSPDEIDRLAIVKVSEKERAIERAFFYASSPEEYEKNVEEVSETVAAARREERITFVHFNTGYLNGEELDLLEPYIKRVKKETGL
jgi:hypothetical protein